MHVLHARTYVYKYPEKNRAFVLYRVNSLTINELNSTIRVC